MLVHLVVTVLLAGIACLLLWVFCRQTGRHLPGYALPMVGASIAIAYGVYAEYSWASRMESGLPASIVVLERIDDRSALAPWTWIVPRVERFSAVDLSAIRRHPEYPNLRLSDVLLLQRFSPVLRVPQLVDCEQQRVTDVPTGNGFSQGGLPDGIEWQEREASDNFVSAVCSEKARELSTP